MMSKFANVFSNKIQKAVDAIAAAQKEVDLVWENLMKAIRMAAESKITKVFNISRTYPAWRPHPAIRHRHACLP